MCILNESKMDIYPIHIKCFCTVYFSKVGQENTCNFQLDNVLPLKLFYENGAFVTVYTQYPQVILSLHNDEF